MKVSASIELVMQLAAQEAIAGEYEEIGPEHLLMGMLKFAELPVDELEKICPKAGAVRQLTVEVEMVGKELKARRISATEVRRRLRSILSSGGKPYEGGTVHRSRACREAFDAAAKVAGDCRSEGILIVHLLEAVLRTPTDPIAEALGRRPHRHVETPLLDEHGRDLPRMAADGRLPDRNDREAERKVLMRALSQEDVRVILLITDDQDAATAVIEKVAQSVASKDCPQALEGTRIVDLGNVLTPSRKSSEALDLIDRLLAEAACDEQVVVCLPPIEVPVGPDKSKEWPDRLKGARQGGTFRCVVRVSPGAYRRWIGADPSWASLAEPIWIHDSMGSEVPWEL